MPDLAPPLRQVDRTYVRYRRRRLIYFGGCDYFRLASHPSVLAALRRGLAQNGLNVAASRKTSGNHPLYEQLEQRLAQFFDVESATLAPNGWSANLMAAQALAGQFSRAFIDERAHPSLADAASFLNCPVIPFGHRDPADLRRKIQTFRRARCLVLTDGLFASDGAIAPLGEYASMLSPGSLLLIDEAHSAGVLGPNGRGAAELLRIPSGKFIQTVTLSKAFGVFGGAVLGARKIRAWILDRSSLFTGSTPLPLPLAAAALSSIAILRKNRGFRARLQRNVAFLREALERTEDPAKFPGPIVSIAPANPRQAAANRASLLDAGIYPPFLKYPGGPAQGAFRFAISSEHTRSQLLGLARALRPFVAGPA